MRTSMKSSDRLLKDVLNAYQIADEQLLQPIVGVLFHKLFCGNSVWLSISVVVE